MVRCKFLRFQQAVVRLYQRTATPLGDKEILPLDIGRSQDAVLAEKPGIKQTTFHGQGDDTFHIIHIRIVKAVRQFIVKLITGRDIISFSGIDVRQRFYQCGKSSITFPLHDTTHHAVVHETGAHGEIIQPLFYSSHSACSFSFSCFRRILSATT